MGRAIFVGTDGSRKMSKSLGNQIGITDEPGERFGKAMSIPEEAMGEYYRLLIEPHSPDAAVLTAADLEGSAARDAKRRLAHELVAWLHSEEAAARAESEWDRVFAQHELPEEIEEATLPAGEIVHVPALIADQFGISRSEARRLLEQGGVWLGSPPLRSDDPGLPGSRAVRPASRVGLRP